MRYLKCLLCSVFFFWFAGNQMAVATTITYFGHGTATHTSEDLSVTNPFTSDDYINFTFSYESDTPDLASSTSYGRYLISSISGTLFVDGTPKAFGPNGGSVIDIDVFPDFADYEWYIRASILFDDPIFGEADLSVSLRGPEGGYLGELYGDSLIPPPEVLLPATQWYVALHQEGNISVSGIDTMHLQPVPEPSTVILLTTGLVGLVGYRRKVT